MNRKWWGGWAMGVALVAGLAAAQATPITTTPTPRSPAETLALTRGRALLTEFYAVKLDGLWNAFTPQVRAQWGTPANFRAFRELGVRQYGRETRVTGERVFERGGEAFYVRSAVFEKSPSEVWALVIGFKNLRVSTFGIVLEEDLSERKVAVGGE